MDTEPDATPSAHRTANSQRDPSKEKQLRLHHLPSRSQNLFYSLLLFLSPLSNVVVNALIFADLGRMAHQTAPRLRILDWVLEFSGLLPGIILALLGTNIVFALLRHGQRIRRSLLLFGSVSSLYLLLNLISTTYGIFAFKIQSLFLLGISAGIYISINTVFLFWYWYFDYPSQIRHLYHPELTLQIVFPGNAQPQQGKWLPRFIDYLYLTLMTSNTLGPPESHLPNGDQAKLIQMLHSVVMLVLLVIFVSRAINTLT